MIPTSLIPYSDDDSRQQRFHFVVLLLLLTNIVVFIYQISLGQEGMARFVFSYAAVPFQLTEYTDVPPTIDYPIWVTAFTSMFMHGGLLHIASNMLYLWVFGDNIEDAMGPGRFLLFYLLCGLGALAAQIAIDPGSQTPIVGASGAIAGILGAYLMLFPRGRVKVVTFIVIIPFFLRLPALIVIGFWIVIQFVSGWASIGPGVEEATGGVAYFAHIGGFLTGIILVWFFRKRS
ncbi:rhomboid family intramembrane serine protease [soil metagenome]|jgi:membrane associated rhomboid family serine protease